MCAMAPSTSVLRPPFCVLRLSYVSCLVSRNLLDSKIELHTVLASPSCPRGPLTQVALVLSAVDARSDVTDLSHAVTAFTPAFAVYTHQLKPGNAQPPRKTEIFRTG